MSKCPICKFNITSIRTEGGRKIVVDAKDNEGNDVSIHSTYDPSVHTNHAGVCYIPYSRKRFIKPLGVSFA